MLSRAKSLRGYHLGAIDGELGHVRDLYFDDHNWHVRYLVADTGGWLPHRKVLISPHAVGSVDHNHNLVNVQLTRDQIEKSPTIDADKPVSRQFEEDYFRYFGWPFYWSDPLLLGMPATTPPVESSAGRRRGDPHLRSMDEVLGYHIQARDGEIGHVGDFLIDESDWAIRDLIVDTRNWLPGKQVLIAPQWVKKVSWEEAKVYVRLDRDSIRKFPEFHLKDEERELAHLP